jgi:hypothetical protein
MSKIQRVETNTTQYLLRENYFEQSWNCTMMMKNVITVPKMLRIVDLSISKNRCAENFGKFCTIALLNRFSSFLSFADKCSVFLLNL